MPATTRVCALLTRGLAIHSRKACTKKKQQLSLPLGRKDVPLVAVSREIPTHNQRRFT